MKILIRCFISFELLLQFIVFSDATAQEKIVFLFYNDFHSQNLPFQEDAESEMSPRVGGAATLGAYINHFRAEYAPNVCVVNAGDDFQGSPSCTITNGQSQIEILNLIIPDVMTLGNHEFDYGREGIERLFSQAKFPIICTNIIDKKNAKPLTPPYLIKKIGAVRVGFIGLLTNGMEYLTLKENIDGYKFLDTEATLMEYLPELKQKTDIIVVVSHLGYKSDISLARKTDDINIIFGGHTHKTLIKPYIQKNVIICQAGSRGNYLGILEIFVNVKARKIAKYKMRLVKTFSDEIEPDPQILQKVNEIEAPIGQQLSEVIGKLELPWLRAERAVESNIAIWIVDAIRAYSQTDVAFINASGIRKDLPAGDITVRDIWEIEPFSNTVARFQVTGKELKQILENSHSTQSAFLVPSGLCYQWIVDAKRGNRIRQIRVNGKPLQMDSTYTVSSNNFLTSDARFKKTFGLKFEEHEIVQTSKLIRDVMIEKIRQEKVICAETEQRIERKAESASINTKG